MLLELLIAGLVALLIGAATLSLMQANYSSRAVVQGENVTYVQARHVLDILCDSIRNAQSVQIQASPVINSALSAGTASSVTCYTGSGSAVTRYWLDTTVTPPALKKTSGGVTTVMVSGCTALTLTYYTVGQFTAGSASWSTTANPQNPTSAELPKIGAIGISASLTINGYTRPLACFVRLRNSPY